MPDFSAISIRRLKPVVLEMIRTVSLEQALADIHRFPPMRVINTLLSLLYHPDEPVFWTTVSLIGETISRLFNTHAESGRVIMRRLMWNLNDESGGIGWGSPEAMGEIMARNKRAAAEYGSILISYIRLDGNFIEHPGLQAGVLWGLGRLLNARPDHAGDIAESLIPFLQSPDAHVRGLAAWAGAAVSDPRIARILDSLKPDRSSIRMYLNGVMAETTVGEISAGNPV